MMGNNTPPQLTEEARVAAACEKSFFAKCYWSAFNTFNPSASPEARKKAIELICTIADV